MNNHKQWKTARSLALLVMIAAALGGLTGCTLIQTDSDINTPESTYTAVTPETSDALSEMMTDEEIIAAFKEDDCTVIEIRDKGELTMVQYYTADSEADERSRFAWFDRETGDRQLACDGLIADRFYITDDQTLMVLTTGRNAYSGHHDFPEIYTFEPNGDGTYSCKYNPYYMPIEHSIDLSDDRRESLASIEFFTGDVKLTFEPQPGYESAFNADYTFFPKMNITNEDGYSTITLYHTIPSEDFAEPEAGAGDSLVSFVSIECDGTDTVLTLKLSNDVERYNVSTEHASDDTLGEFPIAVIVFTEDEKPDYPKGW